MEMLLEFALYDKSNKERIYLSKCFSEYLILYATDGHIKDVLVAFDENQFKEARESFLNIVRECTKNIQLYNTLLSKEAYNE